MDINLLEKSVSTARLQNCALRFRKDGTEEFKYLTLKKDLADSYMLNERVSKEIRFTLSHFEVLLRNRVNEALVTHYGPNWTTEIMTLEPKERKNINDAIERITENGKDPNHLRIVAKLSFSFWVRLFNSPYSEILSQYRGFLFPRNNTKNEKKVLSMKEIRVILGSLNAIRNKVSHQEFILDQKYKIRTNYEDCLYIMRIMEKDYYLPFLEYDSFSKTFEEYKSYRKEILEREDFTGYI